MIKCFELKNKIDLILNFKIKELNYFKKITN